MNSRFLVLAEGYAGSEEAAKRVAERAKQSKAAVIILSVIKYETIRKALPRGIPLHMVDAIEDRLRVTATEQAETVRRYCIREGVWASTIIAIGDPLKESKKTAQEYHADLILTGSIGKSAYEVTDQHPGICNTIPARAQPLLKARRIREFIENRLAIEKIGVMAKQWTNRAKE